MNTHQLLHRSRHGRACARPLWTLHCSRHRIRESPVGQPIIDAVDYVFDKKFSLAESAREDFHFKTSVRFDY